jgi:hypothetical protein
VCTGLSFGAICVVAALLCLFLFYVVLISTTVTHEKGWARFLLRFRVSRWILYLDGGLLKILFSTYQIASTVSWGLNIVWPEPFDSVIRAFSAVNLELIPFSCLGFSYYQRIYLISGVPIGLVALNAAVCAARLRLARPDARTPIWHFHAAIIILLMYSPLVATTVHRSHRGCVA